LNWDFSISQQWKHKLAKVKWRLKKRRSSTQLYLYQLADSSLTLGGDEWVSADAASSRFSSHHICIYSNCEPSHEHHWICMSWTMWILMVLHLQAPTVCLLVCLLLHSYTTTQSIAASFWGFSKVIRQDEAKVIHIYLHLIIATIWTPWPHVCISKRKESRDYWDEYDYKWKRGAELMHGCHALHSRACNFITLIQAEWLYRPVLSKKKNEEEGQIKHHACIKLNS
jgi:hypothetical protein